MFIVSGDLAYCTEVNMFITISGIIFVKVKLNSAKYFHRRLIRAG